MPCTLLGRSARALTQRTREYAGDRQRALTAVNYTAAD
jgi:hypothetical protein